MEDFFTFLRVRMDQSRKWAPITRDYALFRTLYHAGLRSAESATLEIRDLHFDRGPFGKIHPSRQSRKRLRTAPPVGADA